MNNKKRDKFVKKTNTTLTHGGGEVVFALGITAIIMAMIPFYAEHGFHWIDLLWEVPFYGFCGWALWGAWKMFQSSKETYERIIKRETADCLKYLEEDGWSELIDPRWTLEVEQRLKKKFPDYYEESITRALVLVIFPKPDYSPENNETLE